MRIEYGDGKIHTQQGLVEGYRCLTITKLKQALPINSTPKEWDKQTTEDKVDVLIVFKNIESARTLQDELNELIAVWSKEQGQLLQPQQLANSVTSEQERYSDDGGIPCEAET